MFGKLVGYEFKRTPSALLVVLVAAAVVCAANILANKSDLTFDPAVYAVLEIGLSFAVYSFLYQAIYRRFYALFSDEGYLELSFPVSFAQHLGAKLLVAVVWSLVTLACVLALMFLPHIVASPQFLAGLHFEIGPNQIATVSEASTGSTTFADSTGLILAVMGSMLLWYIATVIYVVLSKYLASIVACVVPQAQRFVSLVIAVALFALAIWGMAHIFWGITETTPWYQPIYLSVGLLVALSAGYFVLVNWLCTHKLDLL